jgi:hypothetical protein
MAIEDFCADDPVAKRTSGRVATSTSILAAKVPLDKLQRFVDASTHKYNHHRSCQAFGGKP